MMDDRTIIPLDAETKVSERPDDHKTELRLWLRLLTCTTLIENEVRRRLRDQFDITLPRFDLLAQLDRAPNGMTLGELSQRMMVSNGNITGLVDRLCEQGLIVRRPSPTDRRVQIVSLTAEGRKFFRAMARDNAEWIGEIFAGLPARDIEALMPLLAKTKASRPQGDEERERAMNAANPVTLPLSGYKARHVRFAVDGKVATLTLDRPEKKNPLTFDSYAEIVDLFRAAAKDKAVKAIVVTGAGGNFCSGGDVFEIIEPLTKMNTVELLDFTRMTGDVVKAMRACPQPIIAAIDGVCAGAGAIIAMASDIRIGTAARAWRSCSTASGLPAATWAPARSCRGSSARAGRRSFCSPAAAMGGEEAERLGFFNRLSTSESVLADATKLAHDLANGPTFANAMTKRMLEMEWAMSVETAIEAEAVAQALCMETEDFARAFRAFAAKQKPVFEGD